MTKEKSATETARDMADEALGHARTFASDVAGEARERAEPYVNKASEAASEYASQAQDYAAAAYQRGRSAIRESDPTFVAIAAFALGCIVGYAVRGGSGT
jgi:ElaB/YqjD/DUF883 family membrane-anchored ribosome-binding protein